MLGNGLGLREQPTPVRNRSKVYFITCDPCRNAFTSRMLTPFIEQGNMKALVRLSRWYRVWLWFSLCRDIPRWDEFKPGPPLVRQWFAIPESDLAV